MTALAQTAPGKLLEFLDRLEDAKIDYRLAHIRNSIMVEMVVPSERWEVEFSRTGGSLLSALSAHMYRTLMSICLIN